MNQPVTLTRSKSDDQINKSKVLSPTPIRESSLLLLNHIFGFGNVQRTLDFKDFDESESKFSIRKFQSLDTHEMHQL